MKTCKAIVTLWLATVLTGCSLVPPAQETVLYQLQESRLEPAADSIDLTLKIMSMGSSEALNSRRILITEDGTALHALTGARWISPVRILLRDRLEESFKADGRIARVTTDTASLHSDLELHTVLRNFSGDYSTDPAAAYIRLDATLTDPASRRIQASRQFRVRVASASRSADDMVRAFSAATDQLALELADWIGTVATSRTGLSG